MISFEEAIGIVLDQAVTLGCERVSLNESNGRVLSEVIYSDMDMPPFDKSAVDGYACRIEDIQPMITPDSVRAQNFVPLHIVETIPAGKIPEKTIGPAEYSKIMTGAMVPAGADCVVMVEDAEVTGLNLVRFTREITVKNICYRGEDIRNGDRVLENGLKINPAHVAVMAGMGITNPLVAKLPTVGIISTGDELVEPSFTPGPAQIRNSNGWQLEAQVKTVPALPCYLGIAGDESTGLRKIIDLALANHDVVLLTGGVSMGEFDHVPGIMRDAGVEILFEKVAIQPGKPTVFGRKGDTFIFGLPGNPVSSYVLFELMVRPFLHRMMGNRDQPLDLILPAGSDFSRRTSDRKSMIPAIIRDGAVFPVEYHGSAHINAYTKANAFLVMEIGITSIYKGEMVHVRPI
jgi:molybdopterin molybdotransferase